MDTRSLELFITLSETLHFGRTSEQWHISPSALSRQIKHLEEQVGVQLLLRDNRSVQLTKEGRQFQQYARETLQQWETFRDALQADSQELQGEISLYCSVTASYSFLYDILSEFRRKHPKIEFKVHTGDTAQAIHHVITGQEDIAIAARPDKLPPQLTFRRIAISPLVFIVPAPAHMGEELTQLIASRQWASIPMIVSEGGLIRERLNAWFQSQSINPRIYAQVAGHEAIVSMVGLGFGVGVVPQIVLDNSPLRDRVQVLEDHPKLKHYDVGLCALKKRLKSPLIKAFWHN